MRNDKKFSPPTKDDLDTAHAVSKATLSIMPYLGGPAIELFQFFIKSPLEKRRDEWMELVGETLRELSENSGIHLEELQSNDVFLDIVLQATILSIRNSQEEKRTALRNAIKNAALPNPPEASLQQMFLNFIDTFTVMHIRILGLFNNPSQLFETNDEFLPTLISNSLAFVLERSIPELRDNREFYDQVWNDLYQRGLFNTENLHMNLPRRALMLSRTTPLGKQFLQFIEEQG